MINEDSNTGNPIESGEAENMKNKAATGRHDGRNGWNQIDHQSRSMEQNHSQNERRNLQADDEKREGMPGGQMDPGKRESRQG
jgi:hypothetical protein